MYSKNFGGVYPSLDELKVLMKNPKDKSLGIKNRKVERVVDDRKVEYIENQADTIAIGQVWEGIRDYTNNRSWE